MSEHVIGIDVGTGSARAGVFDLQGNLKAAATCEIDVYKDGDFAEQSSRQIWDACAQVVRQIVAESGVNPADVVGLSYDATCSLVAVSTRGEALSVARDGDPAHDIILWMDHRAKDLAAEITATKHPVLRYVGGIISPEMEPPKLKWLKQNLPDTWAKTDKFLDLADFLTWKSTGNDVRSLCTCVCKWTYLGHEGRWDQTFFDQIGIGDLFEGGRVGNDVRPMGAFIGNLTNEAATHFGLTTSCAVGVGLIDAHAGGVGSMGSVFEHSPESKLDDLQSVLALIGGTSSCHMAVSLEQHFIPGVWGPYYGAMLPGMWLAEGGQSATGALIDHVIANHALKAELQQQAEAAGQDVYQFLNARVAKLKEQSGRGPELTKNLHVLPYYHGNRSPRADAYALGIVDGLSLDQSLDTVALSYYAHLQATAYGTRHIIDEMRQAGYGIQRIHACGGGTKNPLWLQEHADITGCDVYLPGEPEAMLLGTAVFAALAAGKFASVPAAMKAMCRAGASLPANAATAAYHQAKYECFVDLYDQQLARRERLRAF